MKNETRESLKGFQRLDLSELECFTAEVKTEKKDVRAMFATVTKIVKEMVTSRKLVQEM